MNPTQIKDLWWCVAEYLLPIDRRFVRNVCRTVRRGIRETTAPALEIFRAGYVGLAEYAMSQGRQITTTEWNEMAKGGSMEMFEWLDRVAPHEYVSTWVLRNAAKHGHLPILERLRQTDRFSERVDIRNVPVWAAFGGHVEILKWFDTEMGQLLAPLDERIWEAAIMNGHLNVIRWVVQGNDPQPYFGQEAVLFIINQDQLEILQYLHNNGHVQLHADHLQDAAVHSISIYDWLCTLFDPYDVELLDLQLMSNQRQPDAAQARLMQLLKHGYTLNVNTGEMLVLMSGSLEMCKWLHATRGMQFNEMFWAACHSGNEDLVLWYLDCGFNTSENLYLLVIQYGHVHVLNWLVNNNVHMPMHQNDVLIYYARAAQSSNPEYMLNWLIGKIKPPRSSELDFSITDNCNVDQMRIYHRIVGYSLDVDLSDPDSPMLSSINCTIYQKTRDAYLFLVNEVYGRDRFSETAINTALAEIDKRERHSEYEPYKAWYEDGEFHSP